MNGPGDNSPNLSELHGDIVLELLGSFGPGLFIPALQTAGKLLQDAHVAGCGGSCGGGGRAGSEHLALRFFGETLPLIFRITNLAMNLYMVPAPQHRPSYTQVKLGSQTRLGDLTEKHAKSLEPFNDN